jgi:recombination protein RecT
MADQFLSLIDTRADEIRALIPKYMSPERFFVLARLLEKDRNLQKCTPQSLFDCVLKAAQCGLEIGTVDQHAYIIPYGNEAQFQPSYRGMIFRLVQAGVVGNMYAEIIGENDPPPRIISGTQRQLVHEFAIGKRGKTVGAYAVATMPNGSTDFELMGEEDIAAIEKAALRISGGKPSPAWAMFRNEMIKKSVIKRMAKRLQGDRRGLMKDDEATRLDLTFSATNRETGELEPEPEIPGASDGTKAPTPRRVTAEVIENAKREDRIVNSTEENECYDSWTSLGGKGSQMKVFLKETFNKGDWAELMLSEYAALSADEWAMMRTWIEEHSK